MGLSPGENCDKLRELFHMNLWGLWTTYPRLFILVDIEELVLWLRRRADLLAQFCVGNDLADSHLT